jgi:hypothetical protein
VSLPPVPTPVVTRYLRRKEPDHPLADSTGCVRIHRAVLYDRIGPGEHRCHWCPRFVRWDGSGIGRLVADHVDKDRWNNDPGNLVPSCRSCNTERAKNPNFPDRCINGHEWTDENTYIRPDGGGRMCRTCSAEREAVRVK